MSSKLPNNVILVAIKLLNCGSDDLSDLIGSISHNDLNSLFDLKNAKNVSPLDTEWFPWSHPT